MMVDYDECIYVGFILCFYCKNIPYAIRNFYDGLIF
jgi:hypothetical protein